MAFGKSNTKTAETPAPLQHPSEEAKNVPAVAGANPVPSTRAERLKADAGKGVSKDRDDKFIPLIRVLQSQSPQCLKQRAEYIKGAEAGDFFLKNTLTPLIKGSEGFIFQPCAFLKCWLEFDGERDDKPNFMGRHADVKGAPADIRGLVKAEDGYDWVDKDPRPGDRKIHRFSLSREHYGFVNKRMAFVFPFGGSGHTTSREWQTLMDNFTIPDSDQIEPSFNRSYKITTVPRSNTQGDWFAVAIEHIGEVTDEEYERGRAFFNAVMSGEQVAENPPADESNNENPAGI